MLIKVTHLCLSNISVLLTHNILYHYSSYHIEECIQYSYRASQTQEEDEDIDVYEPEPEVQEKVKDPDAEVERSHLCMYQSQWCQ